MHVFVLHCIRGSTTCMAIGRGKGRESLFLTYKLRSRLKPCPSLDDKALFVVLFGIKCERLLLDQNHVFQSMNINIFQKGAFPSLKTVRSSPAIPLSTPSSVYVIHAYIYFSHNTASIAECQNERSADSALFCHFFPAHSS